MSKLLQILKWTAFAIVTLALLLVFATVLLKDKLLQKGIDAINNQLTVPVYVEKVDFSLLGNLPYASILLKNVVVMSPQTMNRKDFTEVNADTLVSLKKMYLSFNIRRLFNDELELKAIKLEDGFFNLLVDASGNDNFHILKQKSEKPKTDATDKKPMEILVQQVSFNNCRITMNNQFKGQGVGVELPSFVAGGRMVNNNYDLKTKGAIVLDWVKTNAIRIVPLAPTKVNMELSLCNDTLRVNYGELTSKGLDFEVSGYALLQQTIQLGLNVKGKSIEVANLLKYFKMTNKSLPMSGSGTLNFNSSIIGAYSSTRAPTISAVFSLANGSVSLPKQHITFNAVNLNGDFTNGGAVRSPKSAIRLKSFSAKSKQTDISGQASLVNFVNPQVVAKLNFDGSLDEWSALLFEGTKQSMKGAAKGTASINGKVNFNKPMDVNSILALHPQANVELNGVSYADGEKIELSNVSGLASLNGAALTLGKTNGRINGINFSFSGSLPNLVQSVCKPYPAMVVNGTLQADKVEMPVLQALLAPSDNPSPYSYKVLLKTNINHFVYDEKLSADNISGQLQYANDLVTMSGLNMQTLDGKVSNTHVVYRLAENNESMAVKGNIINVDISKTLYAFDNFGQQQITSQNIEGLLSATFTSVVPFKNGEANFDKLEFDGHLKVTKGRLHNVAATKQIADFTKLSEFNDLQFSTLENDLSVSNGTVTIPKMDIDCNACDISLYGKQHTSGDYEYHFSIILSDFMRGKAKRTQLEQTPYGIVDNAAGNYMTIYLVASCANGQSNVRFDRKEIKQQLKEEVHQQKQEVKSLLREEFGLFKSDTTLNQQPKKKTQGNFAIEWDED